MDWRCILKGPDGCFIGYEYVHIYTDKFLSKEVQIFSYLWFQWWLGDTLWHFWKLPRGRYTSMGLNPVENLPNRLKFSSSNTSCLKVKSLPRSSHPGSSESMDRDRHFWRATPVASLGHIQHGGVNTHLQVSAALPWLWSKPGIP